MSKNRLKLTNSDLKEAFNFRKHLNFPKPKYYCNIYGKLYEDKNGIWTFDTKEDAIESFITSPIFTPLWDKLYDIVKEKYGYMLEETQDKRAWYDNVNYLQVHNKIEDCINYYKEVLINRMIRTRVIVFHVYK